MNRRWQKSWNVSSEIELQEDSDIHVFLLSLSLSLRALTLEETNGYVVDISVERTT